MMELGLQKRRSSWCDDEGLVWYPCRSWGGQNGVNFPPRLLIFVRAVNCIRCGERCHGNDPVCSALIYLLIRVCRIFISLHLLLTGLSTAIIRCYWNFFSCSFASTFSLLMAMIWLAAGVLRLWRSPVQRSCDPWLRRQRISIHGRGH